MHDASRSGITQCSSGRVSLVRVRYAVLVLASVLGGCSSGDQAPSASWCSGIEPFVMPGPTEGRLEVVEVTDENAERIASESAELRSRITVLVSTSPDRIRSEVDLFLNGSADGDLDAANRAREEVRSYVEARC